MTATNIQRDGLQTAQTSKSLVASIPNLSPRSLTQSRQCQRKLSVPLLEGHGMSQDMRDVMITALYENKLERGNCRICCVNSSEAFARCLPELSSATYRFWMRMSQLSRNDIALLRSHNTSICQMFINSGPAVQIALPKYRNIKIVQR